jgi:hypothetical protein
MSTTAEQCAIEVLSNCAAKYTNPDHWTLTAQQSVIDNQVRNAAKMIREFAEAYAHSRITSLAEEAEREAEAHYNIAPPHRYHADLDQCKFKRAIAAWLRQKAEEGQ